MAKAKSKANKKSKTVKAKIEDHPAPDTGQTSNKSSGSTTPIDDPPQDKTETPKITRRSVAKEAQKSVAAQLEEHTSKTKSSETLNNSKQKTEDPTKPKTPTVPEEGMQLRRSQRKVINRVIPGAASPDQNFMETTPSTTPKKTQPPPPPPPQPQARRLPGGHYIELMMECSEDELSSYQIEAHKKANEEYLKAKKLIEAAKTGQLVINGSQTKPIPPKTTVMDTTNDEDLIIVGETPAKHPAQVHSQAQVQPQPQVVQPQPQLIQRHQMPHLQQVPRHQVIPRPQLPQNPIRGGHQTVTRQTLATPPTRTQLATRLVNPQQVQISNQNPVSGVFPQQVYKFVNVQNPSQPLGGQWTIRPLVKVMPQQAHHDNNHQIVQFQKIQKPQQPVKSPEKEMQAHLKVAGSLFGQKKVSDPTDLGLLKKKQMVKKTELDIGPDKWVPLDEYYYGKLEGDRSYTEEKGEYRFKCWYCMKMLYNNVRTMMHVQGHIDSEKQQNIDLSDLTQCKHCYKQFDTPFEMQTHVEKVHLNASNVLMCRICEKDLDNRNALTSHMRNLHNACEMPYICPLCNFRSSMYIDVVDHFKKKHDSSQHLLCLYCLKIFNVKFVLNGWAQTKNYYHHLLKHQSKSTSKKCPLCKLTFINVHDMVAHKKKDHQSNIQKSMASKYNEPEESDQVLIRVPQSGMKPSKESKMQELKSLNAPAVSKVKDYYGIKMADEIKGKICYECTMPMNAADHYKKHVECVMCRFATSCSYAYASHMMGFHSGQMTSLNLNIPWERPMSKPMYCLCGFGSKYGNKIATHLVYCTKRTCYSTVPDVPHSLTGKEFPEPQPNTGANLLDVLGLVKKQNIIHSDRSSSDRDLGTSKEEESGSSSLRGKRTRTAPAEIHSVKKFKPSPDVQRRSLRGKKASEDTKDNEDESDVVVIDDSGIVDVTKTAGNKAHELCPETTVMSTVDKKSFSDVKETKDSAPPKDSIPPLENSLYTKHTGDTNSSKTVVQISDDVSDMSACDKGNDFAKKSFVREKCSPDAKGDASNKYETTEIDLKSSEQSTSNESKENKSEGVVKSTVKSLTDENETSSEEAVDQTPAENELEKMEIQNVLHFTSDENETRAVKDDSCVKSAIDNDKIENMEVDSTMVMPKDENDSVVPTRSVSPAESINECIEDGTDISRVIIEESSNSNAVSSIKNEDTDTQECDSEGVTSTSVDTSVNEMKQVTVDKNVDNVIKSDDTFSANMISTSLTNTKEDKCTDKSSEHANEDLSCNALHNSSTMKAGKVDHQSELKKTEEAASVSSPIGSVNKEYNEVNEKGETEPDDEKVKMISDNSNNVHSTILSSEFCESKETDNLITDKLVTESSEDHSQSADNKESSVYTSIKYKDNVTEEKDEEKAVSDNKDIKLDKSGKSSNTVEMLCNDSGGDETSTPNVENTLAASTTESKNKEQPQSEHQQSHEALSESQSKDSSSCEQKPSPSSKTTERTPEKSWEKHSQSDERSRERYNRDRSDDRSRDRDRGSHSRDGRDYRSSYSGNDYRSHHGGNYYRDGHHRDGGYHQDNRDSGRYAHNDNYYGNRQRHDRYDHHSDRYDRSQNDQRRDHYSQQKGGYRSGYR